MVTVLMSGELHWIALLDCVKTEHLWSMLKPVSSSTNSVGFVCSYCLRCCYIFITRFKFACSFFCLLYGPCCPK